IVVAAPPSWVGNRGSRRKGRARQPCSPLLEQARPGSQEKCRAGAQQSSEDRLKKRRCHRGPPVRYIDMTDTPCGAHCARLCTRDGLAAMLAADHGLLHWRAMRSLGDRGLAEHAVQETLLRGWRACGVFDERKGTVR